MCKGSFREDLYYRLNRMPIYIPPLRNRKEDIPVLSSQLIEKINREYGRNVKGITEEAILKLQGYDWPGNVRELENILSRAIIFMNKNETLISVISLPENLNNMAIPKKETIPEELDGTLAQMVEEYEKRVIKEALEKNKGNKTLTAKLLGLSLRNLYYKLEKYQLAKIGTQ